MLAIPSGMYHTFILPYFPICFVDTEPVLQLILIPVGITSSSLRYLSLLNAVTVEHPSRYARWSGRLPPWSSLMLSNWCAWASWSPSPSVWPSRFIWSCPCCSAVNWGHLYAQWVVAPQWKQCDFHLRCFAASLFATVLTSSALTIFWSTASAADSSTAGGNSMICFLPVRTV